MYHCCTMSSQSMPAIGRFIRRRGLTRLSPAPFFSDHFDNGQTISRDPAAPIEVERPVGHMMAGKATP
jgi:hypothetical protein